MQARKATSFAAFVAGMLLAMTSFASAGAYSNVFVYGDSLSDTGNIYFITGHTTPPSPPYYNGRFSNGPLAVEYLANALHSPLTSFAWGGATTGIGDSGDGGTQTTLGMSRIAGDAAAGAGFAARDRAFRADFALYRVGRPGRLHHRRIGRAGRCRRVGDRGRAAEHGRDPHPRAWYAGPRD